MQSNIKIKYNGGAAMMVLVLFFVFISLSILIGVVTPTVREFKIASDSFKSKQTYFLAESGIEDVLYRLRNSKQTSTEETLVLGGSETVTTITNLPGNQKQIVSLGNTDSIERKVNVVIDTGVGVAFSYGVQTGIGGFTMANGSQIDGSVYSNGSIIGTGSITGSATSANPSALISDQSNGSGTPPYNISFGNSSGTQDFAQSFKVNETGILNNIRLYIKKISTPSNITVRIVANSNGSPSATTLASGILSASLISKNYGWVEVPFSTNIELSSGTTYWLVLDSSTSSSKYYKIGANSNGYANGIGKIGVYSGNWNNTTPSGLDGFFDLYLGDGTGLISGVTVGTDSLGNTYAHTVENTTIMGTNYCKTGSGNNKSCNTSKDDPVQIAMPVSEQNIEDWKAAATIGGPIEGDYVISSDTPFGPKKITGNLTIDGKITVTMGGVIWVEGNLILNNNSTVKLNSGYGTSEGVIIVDGTVEISNGTTFAGSGSDGSYIMVLSTSSSTDAIHLSNNAGAVTLYAANGTINVDPNGKAASLTGYSISLKNNAIITYDEGITNANFVSGPSGTWNVNSWKEVE